MFDRNSISPDEAATIKSVASNLAVKMAECGPYKVECFNGTHTQHNRIQGFDYAQARTLIEDGIWELLLKL